MFLMACLFSVSHVLRWNGGIDVYECLREENTALKVEAFFVLGNEFSRACFVWEAKSRNLHILVQKGTVSLAWPLPEFD